MHSYEQNSSSHSISGQRELLISKDGDRSLALRRTCTVLSLRIRTAASHGSLDSITNNGAQQDP